MRSSLSLNCLPCSGLSNYVPGPFPDATAAVLEMREDGQNRSKGRLCFWEISPHHVVSACTEELRTRKDRKAP